MFDPDRRHLIAYLAAAAVLVVIAVRFIANQGADASPPSISMAAPATPRSGGGVRPRAAAKPSIWIDVVGAVRRPGLYVLPAGARVATALEKAGGVRARADRAAVNLAAKLADGQQIVVPLRRPGASGVPVAGASAGVGMAPAGAGSASGAAGGAPAAGATISLSNATQEQLEQLDGIGPALAGRIIQYREEHGGFRSVDQLQEVSGIGDKRFQALKSRIEP